MYAYRANFIQRRVVAISKPAASRHGRCSQGTYLKKWKTKKREKSKGQLPQDPLQDAPEADVLEEIERAISEDKFGLLEASGSGEIMLNIVMEDRFTIGLFKGPELESWPYVMGVDTPQQWVEVPGQMFPAFIMWAALSLVENVLVRFLDHAIVMCPQKNSSWQSTTLCRKIIGRECAGSVLGSCHCDVSSEKLIMAVNHPLQENRAAAQDIGLITHHNKN